MAGDVDEVGCYIDDAVRIDVQRCADGVDAPCDLHVRRNTGVRLPVRCRDRWEPEQAALGVPDVGEHAHRAVIVDVENGTQRRRGQEAPERKR